MSAGARPRPPGGYSGRVMSAPLGLRGRLLGALALACSVALAPGAGCSKDDDGTSPLGERTLPPLEIRDDTPNLMLTWIDERGETHVELKPEGVPEKGKGLVRVIVVGREEGTRDLFWVVDLTRKGPGGAYAARTMPRSAWESEIEKRRAAHLAKLAPPPLPAPSADAGAPTPPAADVAGKVTVVIYGAEWCRPCHQAAAFFKAKGAHVVEKDVEKSPEALAEMRDKLDKIGRRGGSIPVIDVRGEILVGFGERAAERALAKAASGTAL